MVEQWEQTEYEIIANNFCEIVFKMIERAFGSIYEGEPGNAGPLIDGAISACVQFLMLKRVTPLSDAELLQVVTKSVNETIRQVRLHQAETCGPVGHA